MQAEDPQKLLTGIRQGLRQFLATGFSKAELARSLKISRSTLIHILDDADYVPSSAIIGRLESNLDWLEKTKGHDTLDVLLLLYFQHENVLNYFQTAVDRTERITGIKVGYHGTTLGGPVGFMIFHTPGNETWTELVSQSPFNNRPSFGRTESFLMGRKARTQGNHEEARIFYEKNPNGRVYLQLFQNYGFTTYRDLHLVQKLLKKSKYRDSIYCLESGVIVGKYDYFFLIVAKDEAAYSNFLNEEGGVYDTLSKSLNDSKTLSITPQHTPGLFKPGNFNLSFNADQIKQQMAYESRNQGAH
jgi:hypothetical protein